MKVLIVLVHLCVNQRYISGACSVVEALTSTDIILSLSLSFIALILQCNDPISNIKHIIIVQIWKRAAYIKYNFVKWLIMIVNLITNDHFPAVFCSC